MSEILTSRGPDSYLGYLVSTMQGATDTTFYVLAVYFGAVGIKKTRHAVPAGLAADAAGSRRPSSSAISCLGHVTRHHVGR
jgi:spore maturation protein B